MLGIVAGKSRSRKAALKTLGEPATARLPVEAELAKAEAELTREKAEAGGNGASWLQTAVPARV